ncbi:hypothetical protein [Myroides odoratimimus]|uniref:hypothetical protein n=1 Tax=Myroides odoratimimus TaxID=76832 RepID=UPI00046AA684|nr:hypothetical protein [Myroides odoratimimus]
MSQVYIPQDTWIVCTNQLNTGPRKLITTRMTVTVVHQKTNGFLTVEDRNTAEKFICKSPMSFAMGIAGFIVGTLVAIFIVSTPIGWVAGAALLVLASTATIVAVSHSCTGPLESGKWINIHIENVRFNKAIAITNKSMLQCGKNGILKPIISYPAAKAAAKGIAYNNISDVAVTTTSAVVSGYLFIRFGGGTVKKALQGTFNRKSIKWLISGVGATVVMTKTQEMYMQGSSEYANNEVYQQMNSIDSKNFSKAITYVEEASEGAWDAVKSLDPPSLEDIIKVTEAFKAGELLIKDQALRDRVEKLSKLGRSDLKKAIDAKNLLKEMADGQHPDLYNVMKETGVYNSKNMNPTMTKAGNKLLKETAKNHRTNIGVSGLKFGLFFTPLINGDFSERARRRLAEEAIKDVTDGINVGRQN